MEGMFDVGRMKDRGELGTQLSLKAVLSRSTLRWGIEIVGKRMNWRVFRRE